MACASAFLPVVHVDPSGRCKQWTGPPPLLHLADASAPTYTTPSIFVFTTVDAGTTWLGARVGKAFG